MINDGRFRPQEGGDGPPAQHLLILLIMSAEQRVFVNLFQMVTVQYPAFVAAWVLAVP